MICCSGMTALFLFHLAKVTLTYLPTALLVGLRPLFLFHQAQVFLSLCSSASSLMVSAAPTSLPLLFSSHMTLVLSSPPVLFSIFSFTTISVRNCLPSHPVLSGYNGSLDTHFSQETTQLMSWPDRERYLESCPLQSLLVSLLSLSSVLLFSRTGVILSHQNSSTHRFPQFPPRSLCFLITLAVFSLIYAATDTAFF